MVKFRGRLQVILGISFAVAVLQGCVSSEITRDDVEKNKREFSQSAYEDAMKKSGRGAELEAEKQRNAAYLNGGQDAGQH